MSPRILLVDDEANIRKMVGALLQSEGFETAEAGNGTAALAAVERGAPDAVLLDLMMPGGPDGLATLEQLKRVAPDVPVVMMSGKATLTDAVRATKLGAFQFLEKPLTPEGLLVAIRGALELARTRAENRRLHEALGHSDPLVGVSRAMDELRALIARVAPTGARVLITGESGTGKELVASAIHRQSARAAKPFVCVNSAAIPKDLVESEMFGHERGAFTGATERRVGRFELADGGTLFLDEVGDLGPEAQAKLLRVLESGVIERLGGEKPVTVDVRVIAATNKELQQAVQQNHFREDLFFRLNVLPVHIPPLRERPEDVPALAEHFLSRFEPRALPLPPETVRFLQSLPWFGNVREFRNALEHAAIVARGGPLLPEHFPPLAGDPTGVTPAEQLASGVRKWLAERVRALGGTAPNDLYAELLRCVEPALLDEVMRRLNGNRWAAAQWLGLNRATVRKKLALYDLHQHPQGPAEDEEENGTEGG